MNGAVQQGPRPMAGEEPRGGPGTDRRYLAALIEARWWVGRNTLRALRGESTLKVVVVSTGAVLLWLGLFVLAQQGFRLLEGLASELIPGGQVSLSEAVMGLLLGTFSLTLFSLLVVSNLLIAFATLYRSPEMTFLLTTPLPPRALFLDRFGECLLLSSWATAYLASPVLLAYGLECQAPAWFYLALLPFYLPFVMMPAALGAILAMVAAPLIARLGRRALILGGLALVLVLGGMGRKVSLPDLSDGASLEPLLASLAFSRSPYLPSAWLSEGLLAAADGQAGEAVFQLLLLLANALLVLWLATALAELWLLRSSSLVASAGSGDGESLNVGPQRKSRSTPWLDRLLRPLGPMRQALIGKDLRLFWRDPAQWSQVLLLFGVLLLYVLNLRPEAGPLARPSWRALAAWLNAGAALLALATLTTRFVFPLISLEGRRRWLLTLAPITPRQLVHQKLLMSILCTAPFPLLLVLISGLRLDLGAQELGLSLLGVLAAGFALPALATGLGALYPRFDEDNPSRIVSGLGGTLCFLLSVTYVALMTAAQGAVILWPRLEPYLGAEHRSTIFLVAILAMLLLSLFFGLVPLLLGRRCLETES